MGQEPAILDYNHLPDTELWKLYHAKDTQGVRGTLGSVQGCVERRGPSPRRRGRVPRPLGFATNQGPAGPLRDSGQLRPRVPLAFLGQGPARSDSHRYRLPGQLPEEELQLRYHQGDPAAFRMLWYVRHQAALSGLAWKMSFGDEDVQDEILSRTEDKLRKPQAQDQYDPNRPWLPWAKTVLYRVALSLQRELARHGVGPFPFDPDLFPNPACLDLEAFVAALGDCWQSLSDDERELLRLHFFEGKTWLEAAEIIGHHGGNPSGWAHRTKVRARPQAAGLPGKKGVFR